MIERPTANLRWIIRDGKPVLQQEYVKTFVRGGSGGRVMGEYGPEWRDVPTVEEGVE